MATVRLVPSAYTASNSSYVTVTNPTNMYYNTDHTANYCTLRGRTRNNTTTYYAFIRGFNFSSVPTGANVTSFTVKIRAYRNSYQQTGADYRIRLASSPSSSSAIANTTLSSDITTTSGGTVYTIPTGSLTWSQISGYGSDFSIEVPLRNTSTSNNRYPYVYVYGAEIEVTYSESTVSVTGVSLDQHTATIQEEGTVQLTETVAPSNATNKTVTWSSNNTSVATVSGGLVTGVSAGTATITVTTQDGGYTDTCVVTVTAAQKTDYILTNTMVPGKTYLVASGNSGSVYLMSNESGGSRQLVGVAATVSNNIISINAAKEAKCAFTCVEYTSGNDITTTLQSDGKYLYCDNSSGLRFNTVASLDRFWHFISNKFWQFKSSSSNGYSDTSSEYKYYLELNSSNNFTDGHVTTTSIEDSTLPAIYLYTPYVPTSEQLYFKANNNWVAVSKAYKKVNGSWVEQSDLSTVFTSGVNYVKGGN